MLSWQKFPVMISNETLEKEMATTPVFWPGEFHGLYNPWGHEELVKTDRFSHRTPGLTFLALMLTLVLDVPLIFVSYMPILPAVFYTPPKMLLTKLSAHVTPIPVSSSSFTDLGSSQFSLSGLDTTSHSIFTVCRPMSIFSFHLH